MILAIIILILGIPIGYLIAWLGRDELVAGRKWLRILMISSLFIGSWFFLTGFKAEAFTVGFILIVTMVGFVKSSDKKFVKQKI